MSRLGPVVRPPVRACAARRQVPSWARRVAQAAAAGQDVGDGPASAGPRGGTTVASKDKGGTKSSKKVATKDLKQKREAKKAKKAAHADRGY